jgi:hypothetical protein
MTIDGNSLKDLATARKTATDNYDNDRDDGDVLIPDPQVARRYHVCSRTIRRWDETAQLNFPEAVRINNRKYRRLGLLRAWERARAAGKWAAKAQDAAEPTEAAPGA